MEADVISCPNRRSQVNREVPVILRAPAENGPHRGLYAQIPLGQSFGSVISSQSVSIVVGSGTPKTERRPPGVTRSPSVDRQFALPTLHTITPFVTSNGLGSPLPWVK